jgi:hypothetical protein
MRKCDGDEHRATKRVRRDGCAGGSSAAEPAAADPSALPFKPSAIDAAAAEAAARRRRAATAVGRVDFPPFEAEAEAEAEEEVELLLVGEVSPPVSSPGAGEADGEGGSDMWS